MKPHGAWWYDYQSRADGTLFDQASDPDSVIDFGQVAAVEPGWLSDITYLETVRLHNKFRWSPVPTLDKHRIDRVPTGATPRHMKQDGKCWDEREVELKPIVNHCYVLEQYYEVVEINQSLQHYFEFVTGRTVSIATGAEGLAATGLTEII